MWNTLAKPTPALIDRININVLVVFVILILAVLTWLPRFRGPIDLRWDGAVYYTLGTSLSEGKGYRLLNEPGEIEATQYPPALPAFIATCQGILKTSDPTIVGHALRIIFFIIFVVYILAVYVMLKRYLPLSYAFLATLVCLFSMHTYFMSDLCFPEIPFALCTVLFVLCNQKQNKLKYLILAALLGWTAYGLRTMGVALLGAWVGESLFNKNIRQTVVRLILALIPVFCWQAYIHTVEAGPQYSKPFYDYQRANYMFYNVSYAKNLFILKDPFAPELGPATTSGIAFRFLDNLKVMPVSLGAAVSSPKEIWELPWRIGPMPFPLTTPWPASVMIFILGCVVLGGIGILLASRQWFVPFYILLSLGLISFTPWPAQFSRYLAPLAPFLALCFFKTLITLKNRFHQFRSPRLRSRALFVTTCLIIVVFLQQLLSLMVAYSKWNPRVAYQDLQGKRLEYRLFFYKDPYRALDAALEWLRPRSKSDDVVAVSMPHWTYLRTGLKSVMPPFEEDPAKAQRLLDSVPVKYLILDQGLAVDSRRYTLPVVQNFPDLWKPVYSDSLLSESGKFIKNGFAIYERVPANDNTKALHSSRLEGAL